jgi:hypothetical protein
MPSPSDSQDWALYESDGYGFTQKEREKPMERMESDGSIYRLLTKNESCERNIALGKKTRVRIYLED